MGIAVAVPLVLAPLAIGTVHLGTRMVVFGLSCLALLVALLERARARRHVQLPPVVYAMALAVAATALQLIPLPASLLAILSPATADLVGERAHAVSLDPAATMGELAKLSAYLAFFLAVSIYATRSTKRRTLLLVVVSTAVLVAAIGFIQAALGSDKVLFFYKPKGEWATWVRGTFVNPNHFGAVMALAAPIALAWGLAEPRWRWPALGAALVLDAAVVMALGRVSIVSAAAGQLLLLLLLWRRGKTRGLWLGATLVLAAVAVVVVIGRSRLEGQVTVTMQEVEDLPRRQAKLQVWAHAVPLLGQFPWTGVGRGAFEPAYQRVSPMGGSLRFEWVENAYLEAPIDWGIPVAAGLYALAAWAFVRLVRRRSIDEPLAAGALAGTVALAIHELGDFAIEIPGVALPGLAVLATLYRAREDNDAARVRMRRIACALPLVLALPMLDEARSRTAEEDGAAVAALARNPLVPPAELVATAEAAHRRHPADAYIPTVVAERLVADKPGDALGWINLAMARNPAHPIPHLMAAELLARSGRKSQALVEYRLAAEGAPDPRTLVFPRVRAHYPAVEDLIAATPADRRGLGLLAKWLASISASDAERVYEKLVEVDPQDARALRALVALALQRKDAGAAGRRLRALLAVDTGQSSLRMAARERLLADDLPAAMRLAEGSTDRSADAFELELSLADAQSRAGATAAARARLDRLLGWGLDRAQRARLHEVRAENERRAGNEHQYRWELNEGARWRKP
ncbi:MAG TPA: O-antigen ligase family protein [Haliangiales bacterium]|nr:O-antigen ligase family protein [Haliangiales bacterium]